MGLIYLEIEEDLHGHVVGSLGLVLVLVSFRFRLSVDQLSFDHFSFFFFPSARAVKIKTGEFEADIYASSCNRILWPDNF